MFMARSEKIRFDSVSIAAELCVVHVLPSFHDHFRVLESSWT